MIGAANLPLQAFNWIARTIEPGSRILELGSGAGTSALVARYIVTSIEHDDEWLMKTNTSRNKYIHAPIHNGWYDVEVLRRELPTDYALLIVDGPPGDIGRLQFLRWHKLFRSDVPWLIDDTHRLDETILAKAMAALSGRKLTTFDLGERAFAVLEGKVEA